MSSTPLACAAQQDIPAPTQATTDEAFKPTFYKTLDAHDSCKAFNGGGRLFFKPKDLQNSLQKAFIFCLVLYGFGTLGQKLLGTAQPKCSAFTYPQCEKAIEHYLDRGAGGRCRAFALVKAEGDFFQDPYSPSSRSVCAEEGCCSCPGQCSKCPPLLPECTTFKLAGSWRVAFDDGSETEYIFDAHGHVEAKMPASSVPPRWKVGPGLAIGEDVPGSPKWVTVEEAIEECSGPAKSTCEAFSYNQNPAQMVRGRYYMFFRHKVKRVTPYHAGSTWHTYQLDAHDKAATHVNIAGPLTETQDSAVQHGQRLFRFDLHRASPDHFAEGSQEILRVSDNSDLTVTRIVKATTGSQVETRKSGVGVALRWR